MLPINVVIVVITTIEALRAFDIAYIINRGRNGLELLSTLITNNGISESNRVGFGIGDRRRPARDLARADRHVPDPDDARGSTMTAVTAARDDERAAEASEDGCRRVALYAFLTFMAILWLLPLAVGRLHGAAAVLRTRRRTATSRCPAR